MSLAIDIKGLRKTYKATGGGLREALKGVDLAVETNELFGFVGVNGAGKSTLIKSLIGLLRPTSGEARIFGFPAGTTQARAKLGYLPEVSNYHEFLTAQELLGIHAGFAGITGAAKTKRCAEVLEQVGLGARVKTRISDFSKGMKQRFGIAQAMIGNPSLLILDELTSGLDPLAQLELKDIMTGLRKQGTTIFFSSHHMAEVEAVCDRVAVLHAGKLRALGHLDELLKDPHKFEIRVRLPEAGYSLFQQQFPAHKEVAPGAQGEISVHLDRAEADKLMDFARQQGGQIMLFSPAQISLEKFYFETVQRANQEDALAS